MATWRHGVCVCSSFVRLLAPLLPAHNYTLEVLPVDSPSSAAVYSDAAFGKQPLETQEPNAPDVVSFTTQRLHEGMRIPLTSGYGSTTMQVERSRLCVQYRLRESKVAGEVDR